MKLLRIFSPLYVTSLALGAELVVPAPACLAGDSEPRWSSFLPFIADEALKRGYELPLPFGVSIIYNYIERDNTASSTVELPGEGMVSFEADQGPDHPRNASVGTSVAFSKRFECFAEHGFNLDDVQMVAAGLTFRF